MAKYKIKLKHPKSCNHCPAFFLSMNNMQTCALGYKLENLPKEDRTFWRHFTLWEDLSIKIKPGEPCPKPKNTRECAEIRATGLDVNRYSNPNSLEYKKEWGDTREMTEEESQRAYINRKMD